jgi:ABC-2 type transport system ATP-binding protein
MLEAKPMVEVVSVCKSFQTVKAVDSVSFAAREGEIFGLIGPNGAGKTTTIRMIMNILAPDSGQILFDGKPMTEADKDRIGYLPEERGLYRKLKVNEALLYLASIKGTKERDAQKEIDSWLERLGLSEWRDRKIEELSKGMAQKIQFIGAVAHKPKLVFFDEPFSGLDPVSSDTLLSAMISLRDEGRTILFSTHIMEQAEKICNKVLMLNRGKEVVSGELSEVKEKFGKNSVVIEFDGDASFVAGLPFVEKVIAFPRHLEAELKEGAKADDLLLAVAGKISVRRFELMHPSLHKIFVKLAGDDEGGAR